MDVDKMQMPAEEEIPMEDMELELGEGQEIEDGVVEFEDGSAEVDLDGSGSSVDEERSFGENIAAFMDESDLNEIGMEIKTWFQEDMSSRAEWTKTYSDGLRWLGFNKDSSRGPWEGSCDVTHPLLAEATVRFQSNAISEIFPADGPVKVKVVGSQTEETISQANRVKDYMNYLLTDAIEDYRDEYEKLLFILPVAGSAFKKVMFDQICAMPSAEFIPAEDLVVDYGAKSLEKASRVAHLVSMSPNDYLRLAIDGFYLNLEIDEPGVYRSDVQEAKDKLLGVKEISRGDGYHKFIEMHCDYDLPGDEHVLEDGTPSGLARPYVITVDFQSGKVLSIRRNWKEGDPREKKRNHFVHYQYVPGTGFYAFGLTHLVGGIAESATSLLRQLVDSGTLANIPGGFRTKGIRIDGDSSPIRPGEWRDVSASGVSLRESFLPLPYKEPSAVLAQLMNTMVEDGRRFASLNDIQASEMNNQAPVGTTLAILERTMKVMSAIHSRLHAAARKEFKLISEIIVEYGPNEYPYDIGQYTGSLKEDFGSKIDVLPVSDPNASTMAQRIMTHQAAFQNMQSAPEIYNKKYIHRQFLMAINMKDVDQIIPPDNQLKNKDPVTENVDIIMGNPAKVFEHQDHEAHIEAHMAAMQDPKLVGLLEQSPNAKAMQGTMAAHIQEHVAYAYRDRIQQVLGFQMPAMDQDMPEDSEIQFSRVVSQAARKLTEKSIAEQKQLEAKQITEDPNWQLRKQEMDIKQRASEAKIQNDAIKAQLSAFRELSNLSNKEQDRVIEIIKVLLDAEAEQFDLTSSAAIGEIEAAIKLMQTLVTGAEKADRLSIDRGKNGRS